MGTSMVIRTTAPQIPEQVQVGGKKQNVGMRPTFLETDIIVSATRMQ